MIKARAQDFSSLRYLLFHSGQESVLSLSHWRERATYVLGGEVYRFRREGWGGIATIKARFLLNSPAATLALARRESGFWRDHLELEHAGRVYMFQQASIWANSCTVHDYGRHLGEIRQGNRWSREVTVELPDAWPLPLQAFTLWLVLGSWRRFTACGDPEK